MLEAAESGQRVSAEEYDAQQQPLRVDLINTQEDLRSADFGVLILVVGDDRPACEEVIDLLHEWMDARGLDTHVFGRPTEEEAHRPRLWRFWRALPPAGRTAIHLGAWPLGAITDHARGAIGKDALGRRIANARGFEELLTQSGTLVLKFWLHLPKKAHKKRVKRARKNPDRGWQLDAVDWAISERYDEVLPIAERWLKGTHTEICPWHIVESIDDEHRDLTVASVIRDAIAERLAQGPPPASRIAAPETPRSGLRLADTNLTARLEYGEYRAKIDDLQRRLRELHRGAHAAGVSTLLVFEGWDAAGKGGVIRRITKALPAREYRVVPIAAPTDEEQAHHYLWRFWRHLPRSGRMLILDRSHYGRVLVERVEGFAREDEWRRAYGEIADFEAQLAEHGMPILKFFLHIDRGEQLRRFRAREQTAYKKYKITGADYRNRENWPAYTAAIDEMLARTSNDAAPWHVIAANDKRWARVRVLEAVCARLELALDEA